MFGLESCINLTEHELDIHLHFAFCFSLNEISLRISENVYGNAIEVISKFPKVFENLLI